MAGQEEDDHNNTFSHKNLQQQKKMIKIFAAHRFKNLRLGIAFKGKSNKHKYTLTKTFKKNYCF